MLANTHPMGTGLVDVNTEHTKNHFMPANTRPVTFVCQVFFLAGCNTITPTNPHHRDHHHHPTIRNPPCASEIEPNVLRNPAIRNPRNDY